MSAVWRVIDWGIQDPTRHDPFKYILDKFLRFHAKNSLNNSLAFENPFGFGLIVKLKYVTSCDVEQNLWIIYSK